MYDDRYSTIVLKVPYPTLLYILHETRYILERSPTFIQQVHVRMYKKYYGIDDCIGQTRLNLNKSNHSEA